MCHNYQIWKKHKLDYNLSSIMEKSRFFRIQTHVGECNENLQELFMKSNKSKKVCSLISKL